MRKLMVFFKVSIVVKDNDKSYVVWKESTDIANTRYLSNSPYLYQFMFHILTSKHYNITINSYLVRIASWREEEKRAFTHEFIKDADYTYIHRT